MYHKYVSLDNEIIISIMLITLFILNHLQNLYKATGHGKGVFCKKISEDDALQGALGNCFAIAAFGTWAGVKGGIILII